MRIPLRPRAADDGDAVIRLDASTPLSPGDPARERVVRYATRTGALLRVGGIVRGAFDREHAAFALPADAAGEIELEVERRALPQTGLPSGDGPTWRYLLATAAQAPATRLALDENVPAASPALRRSPGAAFANDLALVGHSHLDVAWLWTYDEAIRKATRTFATAVRQLEADRAFVFTQTTPQLFDDVARAEPELFERVRRLARAGRFDTSGAALWVECDCNLPSGESLLRQLVHGMRYVDAAFGRMPQVAWLPDTFGFPATLPTLLRHAGIGAFGTTKLGWNDTTTFPFARFAWEGPDGSRVSAAQIASIEGGFAPERVARARTRGDLLLVGRGDGGGGVADEALAAAPAFGRFVTLGSWFDGFDLAALPLVRDELYLEEHRGTLTSQRRTKARGAALERELERAELALAWAFALRASSAFVDEARTLLARAWRLVLRAQFHDVLPGSAIGEAYRDAERDHALAGELVASVAANATSGLPAPGRVAPAADVAPVRERGGLRLRNARLSALIARDGTLRELRLDGGRNLVRRALRLALYVDRPKRWDAWNLDRGYRRRPVRVRVRSVEIDDDGIAIGYAFGASVAAVRVSLGEFSTLLRVEIAVAWNERHRILRLENEVRFAASRARFGAPHGAVERTPRPRSAAERAKYEAPGQRYARIEDDRGGLAVFSRDTYGWSLHTRGATALGASLVRGPTWPDPAADLGEHEFAFALRPFAALGMGELEREWRTFASPSGVPMFTSDDPAIVVVATKVADDGDGIVVRARECDGVARLAALRCAVRAREPLAVDALERPVPGDARFADEALVAHFRPYELRSFRVRVG